jgi:transposase-like protein
VTTSLAAERIYQGLIEAELAVLIGALLHQHTGTRTAHRPWVLAGAVGDLELWSTKLHSGSFCPSLLERRRVDQSPLAVIMEAYLRDT